MTTNIRPNGLLKMSSASKPSLGTFSRAGLATYNGAEKSPSWNFTPEHACVSIISHGARAAKVLTTASMDFAEAYHAYVSVYSRA